MGEIGVGQGLGLVAEQNPDGAGPSLLPQQPAPQAGTLGRQRVLPAFQAVARPAPGEAPFGRSRVLSREGESVSPARRPIAALRRGKVHTARDGSARSARAPAKAAAPAILRLKALRAPQRPYKRTEVWLLLEPRPDWPAEVAQQLIGGALQRTPERFARPILIVALALWGASLALTALGLR